MQAPVLASQRKLGLTSDFSGRLRLLRLGQQRQVCGSNSGLCRTAPGRSRRCLLAPVCSATVAQPRMSYPPKERIAKLNTDAPTDVLYDAIVIGAGMGGLSTAAILAKRGLKVLVLEKYLIPGGSAAHFKRDGYIFDVGSSMMFGFGDKGTTNLLTRALALVGKRMETVPDPTQVRYRLPKSARFPEGIDLRVWRDYDQWIAELVRVFPHEEEGIRKFYGEAWKIFNSMNTLELKSLEEPRYLLGEFVKHPLECLTLASFLFSNTGDFSRKYIKDEELLRIIDIECYIFSTVRASLTPMVNAGLVFSDRHYGGINYPVGGIGRIAEEMADGIEELGGTIVYKANAKEIVIDEVGKATGVRLADGRVFRAKTVVSNATRWDTFGNLVPQEKMPESEVQFRKRYKKSPSFFSMHIGVDASVLPEDTDCHQIYLDDWKKMEDARGVLFISMPSLLDPSLAPPGKHVVHAFTPDWIEEYQDLSPEAYAAKKQEVSDMMLDKLETLFPGFKKGVNFIEAGTPRTHRRYLSRDDGTYGPIPTRPPIGMLGLPFNTTDVPGLYCVGDSCFPGQGVNAVVFSGFGCAHRLMTDMGLEPSLPTLDNAMSAAFKWIRQKASQ